MKKTILYLFFVIILISSVDALWSIEDTLINVDTFLTQFYWTGNKIKFIGGDVNKVNVIKYGSTNANICAVFNTTSFSYLSENFSFSGNNCTITYNFLNDTEYIIALYRDDSYSFSEYYYYPISSPLITSNMLWYGYITNNIADNWSFANEYIVDFTKLEINLTISEPPPANITPNITEINETGISNELKGIKETLNIFWYWILFLFALIFPFIINRKEKANAIMISVFILIILVFFQTFNYFNLEERYRTLLVIIDFVFIIIFALQLQEEK